MKIGFLNVSRADLGGVQFQVRGDGVSTVLIVNLSKPPFSIPFNGMLPSALPVDTDADGVGKIQPVAVLSLDDAGDVLMTTTFAGAPTVESTISLPVNFVYDGL